jgi:hypothetical protein
MILGRESGLGHGCWIDVMARDGLELIVRIPYHRTLHENWYARLQRVR